MDFATYQNLINQNKHRTEDNVVAKFYDKTVKTGQIDDKGLPIFKNVCYCEIRIKDNTTEIFNQPSTQDKIERFPLEYARYQLSKKQSENGTPLEQFSFLSISEIEACKHHGIFTVESLANLDAKHVKNLNLEVECLAAKQFIKNAAKLKDAIALEKQKQEYEQKISELMATISELKKNNVRRKNK